MQPAPKPAPGCDMYTWADVSTTTPASLQGCGSDNKSLHTSEDQTDAKDERKGAVASIQMPGASADISAYRSQDPRPACYHHAPTVTLCHVSHRRIYTVGSCDCVVFSAELISSRPRSAPKHAVILPRTSLAPNVRVRWYSHSWQRMSV